MSDPVAENYGPATWQDFTHNWRKKDGDFLQQRSILRYETSADRDAIVSPAAGTTIFNAENDRLEVRVAAAGGSWNGLYSVDGLIIEAVPTNTVKLRHKDAASNNGMVFRAADIAVQVPLVTGGNELRFDASGLTVSTGTKTARIFTDTNYLVSDSTFQALGLRSTTTLVVGSTSTLGGAVTATSTLTVNDLLTANNFVSAPSAPTATSHLTNKAYVDGVSGLRVLKSGDTMTGHLNITPGHDNTLNLVGTANPYLNLSTGATRRAYIQATADWLVLAGEGTAGVLLGGTVNNQVQFREPHSYINGMYIGRSAHAGWPAIWYASDNNSNGYRLLAYGSATYVNATGSVGLRINNIDQLLVTNTRASMTGQFWSSHSQTDGSWANACFVAYNQGSQGSRVSFYHPGIACQLTYGPRGDILELVNSNYTAHVRFMCNLVYEVSALDTKKDVRSLRPERPLPAAWCQPDDDRVGLPDVMALRPVAFRPVVEPTRLTYDADGNPDGGEMPCSPDDVFAQQARRERLGLIADEVQHVLPSAVIHDLDGNPKGIAYSQIVVALLDHVQRLTEKVESFERDHSSEVAA